MRSIAFVVALRARVVGRVVGAGLAGAIVVAAAACSDSDTGSSGSSGSSGEEGGAGGEGGATGEGGGGGDGGGRVDAGGDAAPAAPVNNCKTFDDRSGAGASRTIAWGFPLPAADRCVSIKAGQSVTFSGNFTQYRVAPSGGDKPNPLADFDPATPAVKFPAAGTFGFESPDAPALVGAIRVTE